MRAHNDVEMRRNAQGSRTCVAHIRMRGTSGRSAASAAGPALLLALLLLRARLRARCQQAWTITLQSAKQRLRASR